MPTISRDSVIIDMQLKADQLIREGKQAERAIETLDKKVNKATTNIENSFNAGLVDGFVDELEKEGIPAIRLLAKELGKTEQEVRELQKAGKIGFEQLSKAVKKSINDVSDLEGNIGDGLSSVRKDTKKTESSFLGLKSIIAGTLSAEFILSAVRSFGKLAAAPTQLAANFETSRIAFKTLLGSFEEADDLLQKLSAFDIKTPFEPAEVQRATQTLLGFGSEAEDVLGQLEFLGNAAASSSSASLEQLAVVFGQVQSIGKLQGQDALQFINAGIPVYDLLSESTGKTVKELKELQEQGNLTFGDLEDALKQASEEGGLFFGAIEAQSKSFSGLLSTLSGNLAQVGQLIGRTFLPLQKEIVGFAISVTNGIQNALRPFVDIIEQNILPVLDIVRSNLKPITDAFADFGRQILNLGTAEGTAKRFFDFIISATANIGSAFQFVRNATAPLFRALGQLRETIFGLFGSAVTSNVQKFATSVQRSFTVIVNIATLVVDAIRSIIDNIKEFSRTSSGSAIVSTFRALQDVLLEVPGIINGVIEVVKALGSNFVTTLKAMGTELELFKVQAQNVFGFASDEEVAAIQRNLRNINAGFINIIDAFNNGRKAISGINADIKSSDFNITTNIGTELERESNKAKEAAKTAAAEVQSIEDRIKSLREVLEQQVRAGKLIDAKATADEIIKLTAQLEGYKAIIDNLLNPEDQSEVLLRQLEIRRLSLEQDAIDTIKNREDLAQVLKDIDQEYEISRAQLLRQRANSDLTTELSKPIEQQNKKLIDELRVALIEYDNEIGRLNLEAVERNAELITQARVEAINAQEEALLLSAEKQIKSVSDLETAKTAITLNAERQRLEIQLLSLDQGTTEYIEAQRRLEELNKQGAELSLNERLNEINLLEQIRIGDVNATIKLEAEKQRRLTIIAKEAAIERLEAQREGLQQGTLEYETITNQITELQNDLTATINQRSDTPIRNGIANLLGLGDEQIDELEASYVRAKGFIEDLFQTQVENIDAEITIQEERITKATALADKGAAEQLQIEEERLAKLNEEREKAVQNQRALANIEIAISQATAAAKTGQGIANAVSLPFPANLIAVPLVLGLVAQIAGAVAATSQIFSGLPSFYEGTETTVGEALGIRTRRGKDQVLARVDIDEMILDPEKTRKVKHLTSDQVVRYALVGEKLNEIKMLQYHNVSDQMPQLPLFHGPDYPALMHARFRANEDMIQVNLINKGNAFDLAEVKGEFREMNLRLTKLENLMYQQVTIAKKDKPIEVNAIVKQPKNRYK